jgi:hypothetical protein
MSKADFQIEEFKALRAELAVLLSTNTSLLQYALVIAAAVFSWLATQAVGQDQHGVCSKLPVELLAVVWFIPAACAFFIGIVAVSIHIRAMHMGNYLLELEKKVESGALGWEGFNQPSRKFRYLVPGTVAALWLIGTVSCGVVGNHAYHYHTETAKRSCEPAK